jgi:hypothetical protein
MSLLLGGALVFAAGCKEEAKTKNAPQPGGDQLQAVDKAYALPTVTLVGTKILETPGSPVVQVRIAASGPFGSNVTAQKNPDRLLIMVHNALVGKAPKSIEVNDGTINRVDIAQHKNGSQQAVGITVGLAGATSYRLVPEQSAVLLEIARVK